MSSITASSPPYNSALLKYPHLHWRISHGAGAFPDISERFLLGFPNESAAAREAYKTRLWYDSAGPVWPKQVKGLTGGLGVGIEQMVFGTVSLQDSSVYPQRQADLKPGLSLRHWVLER